MGARQSSTRSINIVNETSNNTIEISEDVAKRLKSELTKEIKNSTNSSSEQSNIVISNPEPILNLTSQITSSQSSPYVYINSTMSAIEARQEKVEEVEQMDSNWRKRLAQLEQNLNKTNKIMEDEYNAALENVKKRFSTFETYTNQQFLQNWKIQLIECFHANREESLKCSKEVKAFADYVNKCRVQKLDKGIDEIKRDHNFL